MKNFDAIVIGIGAMGSSITYQLASHGIKVLGIERFALNHTNGSSHGKTRIIRTAHFEHPTYIPLVQRSFELWSQLKAQSGADIIKMTGALIFGLEESPLVSAAISSSKQHNLPYEILSSNEAANRFPMFRPDNDEVAFHEKTAGILFPEECIQTYARLAEGFGAEIHFNEPVRQWNAQEGQVEVKTENETYTAKKVIFSAGPWLTELIPELNLPLQVERQVVFWFGPQRNESIFTPQKMPVFIWQMKDSCSFYGIPNMGDGVKAARHHYGGFTPPDKVNRTVTEADQVPVRKFLKHHIPLVDSPPISSTTCLYTNAPDDHFIIDFHPDHRNVLIVSACSGHGFKFSSVIGEIVRQTVQDGKSTFDVSLFRIKRLLN